jgi:hypothetical protein
MENMELERLCQEVNELKAQKKREHPDWKVTRPYLGWGDDGFGDCKPPT